MTILSLGFRLLFQFSPQRGRKEGAERFWAAFGSEEISFCKSKPFQKLSFTFATDSGKIGVRMRAGNHGFDIIRM